MAELLNPALFTTSYYLLAVHQARDERIPLCTYARTQDVVRVERKFLEILQSLRLERRPAADGLAWFESIQLGHGSALIYRLGAYLNHSDDF